MSLSIERDYFNQITPPEFVLCKASGERIGILFCTAKTMETKFNDIDTITFKTPLHFDNGERNPFYDDIDIMKYIEIPQIGLYYIKRIDINSEGSYMENKSVTCDSYEGLLGQKYLEQFYINTLEDEVLRDDDGNPVFDPETGEPIYLNEEGSIQAQFYNISDKEHSIAHLALEKCPEWEIGHVDAELQETWPVFEIDRGDIYSFLTEDIPDALDCFTIFDTVNKTVNFYVDDYYGKDTDIYCSYDNLLKSTNISCDISDIKTCLKPKGADDLGVEEVNFGFDRIYNFDYYATTEYWSQELYDAYFAWKDLYDANIEEYEAKLQLRNKANYAYLKYKIQYPDPSSDYYTHRYEWYTKDKYTLEEIAEHIKEYGSDEVCGIHSPLGELLQGYYDIREARQRAGTYNQETDVVEVKIEDETVQWVFYKDPETGDWKHETVTTTRTTTTIDEDYTKAVQIIGLLEAQKAVSVAHAQALLDEVNRCQEEVDSVYDIIDVKNNFTDAELKELSPFIREEELTTDTFYVNYDYDTDEQISEETHRLLEHARKELAKIAMPQLSFSANVENLYHIPEFNNHTRDLDIGNFIHITLRDDYNVKARITNINIDFYNPSNLTFQFKNIGRKESDVFSDIEDIVNAASEVATSVSLNIGAWKQAARNTTNMGKILQNGLLDAQQYLSGTTDTSTIRIDARGIFVDTDNGEHSKDSIFIGGGRILYTDDDWMTVSEAIGRVTIEGESVFGVLADAVVAGRIYGSTLKGNDIIGGAIVSNNYSEGRTGTYINLVDGTFEFCNNNSKLLTLDKNGNLMVKGEINATSGRIGANGKIIITGNGIYSKSHSSFDSTSDGFFLGDTGLSIGGKFSVNNQGVISADSGVFKGTVQGGVIDGGSIKIGNGAFIVDSNGNMNIGNGNFVVTSGGILTAKGANITSSNVAITGGSIAGWNISTSTITSSNGRTILYSNGYITLGGGTLYGGNDGDPYLHVAGNMYVNDSIYMGAGQIWGLCSDATTASEVANSRGISVYISSGDNLCPYVSASGSDSSGWNGMSCGGPSHKWIQVYAAKSSINTSDRRLKKNIIDIDSPYENLFFDLEPVKYEFYGGDRIHLGYIAQDVEKAIYDNGLTDTDFAALCHDVIKEEDGDEVNVFDEYGLRYEEFIALNTHMIQKLYKRVDELEQEIERIKNG